MKARRLLFVFLIFILLSTTAYVCEPIDTRSELNVAFITSFGGEYDTSESVPAAKLAADVINADEEFLPGYKIVIDLLESNQLPAIKKFANSNVSSTEIEYPTVLQVELRRNTSLG